MKKSCKSINALAWFLFSTLLLMGCAQQVPTRSGFLSDYGDLQPQGKDAQLDISVSPGTFEFGVVHIEPVQFVGDSPEGPTAEKRKSLCEMLERALTKEFSSPTPAASANPRTLRVKAAITGVDSSRPILNLVTALAIFVPVDNGGISVEIEATEEETGRRIAAMSGARNGSLAAFTGFFRRYGHAEDGITELAKEFRLLVQSTTSPIPQITQRKRDEKDSHQEETESPSYQIVGGTSVL